MAKRVLLVLMMFVAAPAGSARAGDDPACARFQEPLAYNACLAAHGPKAPGIPRTSSSRVGDAAPPSVGTRSVRQAPASIRRAARHATLGRGRVHVEFWVR